MILDPKALDAAYEACPGTFLTDDRIRGVIQAYLDAADLVPRSRLNKQQLRGDENGRMCDKLGMERDEARRQVVAMEAAASASVRHAMNLAETRGKQIAALREAGLAIIKYDDMCRGKIKGLPTVGTASRNMQAFRAALTDTAAAAAQWVRVDDEHVVMPVEPNDEMLRTLVYGPLSTRIKRYKALLAAAPQAGEPEGK